MFTRLRAAYGAVRDSGAVEAITRGPDGFLQVMAFLWFCASVLVLWFPPETYADASLQAGGILGPSGLCMAFMMCSVLHVVLLVVAKVRGTRPELGSEINSSPNSEPSSSVRPLASN